MLGGSLLHMTTATAPAPAPTTDFTAPRRISAAIRYSVEAIGTFFLIITIGGSVRTGNPLAPIAIGATLMAMIYAGGHISGAHYNPAVTIAVCARGRIALRDAIGYIGAQLAGALAGAVIVMSFIPQTHLADPQPTGTMVAVAVAEVLFTFALCYVVLNVATSKDHNPNSFYGLAIGFTVVAGALTVGSLSGGAFNPAVVIAGTAMGLFSWKAIWVYVAAQITAGVTAGIIFRLQNPDDK